MPTAAPTPHSEEWVKLMGPEDDNSSVDVSVDFSSHGEPTGRVSRKAVQVLGHELAGAKVCIICLYVPTTYNFTDTRMLLGN